MEQYTQEHLTNLLTTDKEKLTQICAEVCYGWEHDADAHTYIVRNIPPDADEWMFANQFQPLANTVTGRSQAFELAVKFNTFPVGIIEGEWIGEIRGAIFGCETPQAVVVIASILTAQQENNDD